MVRMLFLALLACVIGCARADSTGPDAAADGWKKACKADRSLFLGLNVIEGKVVYPGVAEAFGIELHDPATLVSVSQA